VLLGREPAARELRESGGRSDLGEQARGDRRVVGAPEVILDFRERLEERGRALAPEGRRHAFGRVTPPPRVQGQRVDRGAWRQPPPRNAEAWAKLEPRYSEIIAKHPRLGRGNDSNHLGTLGTGNHFIEVCLDEEQNVWIVLHSGSRGVGNRIGQFFIELAKKDMQKFMINLPDKDLAYLPEGTDHFNDYVKAVHWAQSYAMFNRELMMASVIKALATSKLLPPFSADTEVVNCHNNYVAVEEHYGERVFVTTVPVVLVGVAILGVCGFVPPVAQEQQRRLHRFLMNVCGVDAHDLTVRQLIPDSVLEEPCVDLLLLRMHERLRVDARCHHLDAVERQIDLRLLQEEVENVHFDRFIGRPELEDGELVSHQPSARSRACGSSRHVD
jgi:hypothetical protein